MRHVDRRSYADTQFRRRIHQTDGKMTNDYYFDGHDHQDGGDGARMMMMIMLIKMDQQCLCACEAAPLD